ncbi:hypothetical protein ACFFHG_09390 [Gellertiella hungarica]|uniref:hypothetical protein n=1 Tax=Gellertiella hungarica TaxID=1572859 RepID=UPI00072616E0|nr:hypothetical protein AQY21_03450 [Paracoccus sp. MKU1]
MRSTCENVDGNGDFETALDALPSGYSEGVYQGRRYGVSVRRSDDGRRNSLFARELAGADIVSFNMYRLGSGNTSLKPCEMSTEKVIDFVRGFRLLGRKSS